LLAKARTDPAVAGGVLVELARALQAHPMPPCWPRDGCEGLVPGGAQLAKCACDSSMPTARRLTVRSTHWSWALPRLSSDRLDAAGLRRGGQGSAKHFARRFGAAGWIAW
jgi:hypothetical protein